MDAWSVLRAPAMRSIAILGVVLMAIFVAWLYTAQVVMPILGHASWHLYRKAVER